MPVASEMAANRPLSGSELREILRQDFERLLDAEGLLSPHIGFGRFAYRLRLAIEIDNGYALPAPTTLDSKAIARNIVAERPELAAQEAFPLVSPSAESVTVAQEVQRRIVSPNKERLRAGLPITVDAKQQDGTMITKEVQYPPDPELQPGDVTVQDVSDTVRAEIGRPVHRPAVPPEVAEKLERAPAEKRDFFGAAPERDANAPWPTTKPS